jgi:hypothetical protein
MNATNPETLAELFARHWWVLALRGLAGYFSDCLPVETQFPLVSRTVANMRCQLG